ncbi:MAG: hypothetical protein MUF54_22800, partial [Polyangiaceae bacterium]|nr:hypothetical protein [Polyangiaceae bacterium]
WSLVLGVLAERAVSDAKWSRFCVEARLLYQLQRAAIAFERPSRRVDVATWILSFGRRPVVRQLEDTELRVARVLRATLARGHHARLASADRRTITAALQWAADRAERNARNALRPRLHQVLDSVSLLAETAPEQLGRHKLVEELLDQILEHGFLLFGQLRDAISRNQLKLHDLTGAGELWRGDPLLRADERLGIALDGIYHRSDIYLRVLQKVSSLPFGTRAGRVLALYLLLPLGASFVVLEGVGHILNPLLGLLQLPVVDLLTISSFLVTAGVVFGLLHSAPFRAFARQVLEVVGIMLAWIFFRIPRAVLMRPAVVRLFALPGVRLGLRRILIPMLLAAGVFYLTPLRAADLYLASAVSLGVFAVSSGVMGTRLGTWFEDYVVEQLVPTWQVLSRQWMPGLLHMVGALFSTLMELLQRGIYRIDEVLRFHQGQRGILLVVKAAVGLVWVIAAYIVRVYVTLLVEPEINPLKHFPVVTVAHKLLLPLTPQLLAAFGHALSPLGGIVGGAITGVTVFLLPSVTGFLTWELKENYKLYRATRSELLGYARVGPRGESMRGLLVAGLHSGTLPKLHERLRRAAQREHERAERVARRGVPFALAPTESGVAEFRAAIQQLEEHVRRFVERELLAYLHNARRWAFGQLRVLRIDLSSNRVRFQIACPAAGEVPCELTIEHQAGLLVAGFSQPGFLFPLQRQSHDATLLFETALAGFYHRADVDLVREQLEVELGDGSHYEVTDEGLLVWPGHDYHTELLYRVHARHPGTLTPNVRGKVSGAPPRVLDARRVLYRHQSICWLAWVSAWMMADHPRAELPRLVSGASILPLLEGDQRGSFASCTSSLALLGSRSSPPSGPDDVTVPLR